MTDSQVQVPLTQGKYVHRRLATGEMANKFIESTGENGGATMDLDTGKLYGPGDKGEAVGAEPSVRTKEPITTHVYVGQPNLSGEQFADEYLRLKQHAIPGASIGSWAANRGLELDASRVFTDPVEASKAVVSRDQDASFDFNKMDETSYKEHAERIGSTKPQSKKDKKELLITSPDQVGTSEFRDK